MRLPHAIGAARRKLWVLLGAIVTLHLGILHALAADSVEDAQKSLLRGDYAATIAAADAGMRANQADPEWPLLRAEALGKIGRYQEAREILDKAIERSPVSIRLRLASYEALLHVGAADQAKQQRAELDRLGGMRAWAYRSPADRVALARTAILVGADPKQVLEAYLDPVRKAQPDFRESYLASGELALAKNDFSLAAKTFSTAVKQFPEDPDMWYGLAQAYAPSEPEASTSAVEKALQFNPNHVGAQLLIADYAINAERYGDADKALAAALKVNPNSPEAHAYRSVLANLRADPKGETAERAAALKFWPRNPEVPHLIGRKLSQKYRFAEGAALQREALSWDPDFLSAKGQLANDLLRLGGHDDEAWALAGEVQTADPYDVVAYNLTTLRDAIALFQTLNSEHFIVKMDAREAEIYGPDVLALLERAHETLTRKYGFQPKERTIVEIFPDQKDFAIRTFGLPGGAGYLGVCFGRVITANSPASRPNSPNSWEAVLWHEFCHVVTLTMTKNKMPRWLSEGISVYEERQAQGTWGEKMRPRYRAMILGEDLTPVSQLSAAFLRPKSAAHIGFAYYESSLVVDWLISKWGLEKMKRLLADLAHGVEINAALTAHFAPIETLDKEFAAHAVEIAKNTGPKLDWTPPQPADVASAKGLEDFMTRNPDSFAGLNEQASLLLQQKKWTEAKVPLQKLISLYPEHSEGASAAAQLARVHRELGETDEELVMLNKVVERSSDAVDAFTRLMKIGADRQDWKMVITNAERFTSVNPLSALSHRAEAEAREALHETPQAIAAYRTVLQLGPTDPAEIHFRLARLLHATGDVGARREVLLALEDAPRYRAALNLLLEINGQPSLPPGVTPSNP